MPLDPVQQRGLADSRDCRRLGGAPPCLALASVLIAQQKPDQAVGIAADVLSATQSLGSYLVINQLIQLQRQLEPYSGNAVVAEFLDCLHDAVRDRLAFYQLTVERQHPDEASEGP